MLSEVFSFAFLTRMKLLSTITIDRSIFKRIQCDNTHRHLMKKYTHTHIDAYICVQEENRRKEMSIEVVRIVIEQQ